MNLKERLKAHEGFSTTPYRCPAGYWTIGYGHFMGAGECKISKRVADLILEEDIHQAEFGYMSTGLQLDDVRKDVCVELIFWHGLNGFLGFKKCVTALESGDFETAAYEMMDSESGRNYTLRMSNLAEMMRSG